MKARRLPVVDEYVDGDQTAVFAGGRVLVLSTVASAVLHATRESWTDVRDIARDAVASVGAPPTGGPEEAVLAVIDELSVGGLVEVSK